VFDPFEALAVLQRYRVRFVVIGGLAARLWGSPTMTNDLDACYCRDGDNIDRLVDALHDLEARLRGVEDDVTFLLDAKTIAAGHNFTFTTRVGPLDVLGEPAGVRGFEELDANAVEFRLSGDLEVRVCALEDLERMKRAAGRPKDRVELEILAALRQEWDARGGPPS
jgi:hypothetical protein